MQTKITKSVRRSICLGTLAGSALLTSGCVNALELNKQVLDKGSKVEASVPTVDCGPETSPPAARAVAIAIRPRVANTLAMNGVGIAPELARLSDLEAGRALIMGSGGVRAGLSPDVAAAAPSATLLGAVFGWRIEQFVEDMPRVSEAGGQEARRAVDGDDVTAPSLQRLADVFMLGSMSSDGAQSSDDIKREAWLGMIQHISRATAEDGWTSDFAARLGRFSKKGGLRALASGSADLMEVRDLQRSYLIAAYMKAYFRNGQIFALDFSDKDLKQKLKDDVAKRVTDPTARAAANDAIDDAAGQILGSLCPKAKADVCHALGIIGEQTFVTRAGKSYGFPGVTATFDPGAEKKVSTNKIDTGALITDLVRIAVEAVADANLGVPGVPNSTACSQMSRLCQSKVSGDPDFVTDAQVASISDAGDKAEAATTAAVGAIIRGGWLFSLNNETLAKSIETALGVGARKAAEYAAWKTITGACKVRAQQPYKRVTVTFGGAAN